jgi:hypothetical protein
MDLKKTYSDSSEMDISREVRPTLTMAQQMVLGHQSTMAYGENQYPLADLRQGAPPIREI